MRGLTGLILLTTIPALASANERCEGAFTLTEELSAIERALDEDDPSGASERSERALAALTCLRSPVNTVELARLWQFEGVALARLERTQEAAVALRQAAAVETEDPVLVTEDIELLEPYFEAWGGDWELGRLIVGPVNVDANVYVNGIRQNRTFAPVRAPAVHFVQVFEDDELVFARLVEAPKGDLEVITSKRDEERTKKKSSALLWPSVGVGLGAAGLGLTSFALNQRAGSLATQGERSKAARAFDHHQTLAGAAGGLGALSAIGLGLTLSGTF
ncbi:MAG: hypothetical protein EA397_11460 [Deltaproteobacteria bacterium]|nr:MAG: hypothetical protein EA397_11460 [Deltaproteobacteria bacterium]